MRLHPSSVRRSDWILTLGALLATMGCNEGADTAPQGGGQAETESQAAGHGEHGPHGGHLIELGRNHKYHAELVHDPTTEAVNVYILGDGMQALAISEPKVTLNLTTNGETSVFDLTTSGAESSRFSSMDKQLYELMSGSGDLTGRLLVSIEGVPYVGHVVHHQH